MSAAFSTSVSSRRNLAGGFEKNSEVEQDIPTAVVLCASGRLRMSHDADAPWNKYGGTAGEVYERYMVLTVFSPWSELHLRAGGLQAGERVLDVACDSKTGPRARNSWSGVVALQVSPHANGGDRDSNYQ
jgi:hypothetical protein